MKAQPLQVGMIDQAHHHVSAPQSHLFQKIEKAIDFLLQDHSPHPSLADIANHVGMSPHHFQRTFSDWAGVSPKKFLQTLTLNDAKERLRQSESVLDAAFEVGLSGPGRLHDLFVGIDAVTPGEFKAKGAGMRFVYGYHPSPFGDCLIVASERGMTGLSFIVHDDRAASLVEQRRDWEAAEWIEDADATATFANAAFSGAAKDIRLLLRGTPFRTKVWEALLHVPDGAVISYGDLAARMDRPRAARAVANAVAHNLIGYVIPCHRVIRDTGAISGYRWGGARKSAILGLEAATALETTRPAH